MQRAERGAARRDLCLVVRLEVVVGLSNTRVVAIDGHWFDVADILAEPDVGLVQPHGVSPTGAPGMAPPGRGRRASSSAWTSRAIGLLVMSGHRVTIQTAGTLTGAPAHPAPCPCGGQSR